MRLFIAIELEEGVKGKILHEISSLRSKGVDVAFTSPENLHITVKFFGEVAEQQVEKLKEDIRSTLEGVKPFNINLKGAGYFGRPEFMKVIWIGIEEGNGREQLIKMIKALDSSLSYVRKDDHEPHPHITIGRVKTGRNKELLLHEINSKKSLEIGGMKVKQLKIKKSELTEKGPIYSDLMTIDLKH